MPGVLAGPEIAPRCPASPPAEQAVTRLAAASWSNRQTAAELDISVKTVEFHLGRTFD